MKSVMETARGVSASAAWILGIPVLNARVAISTRSKLDGRAVFAGHCQRFLDTCRVDVKLDGPPPPSGQGCVMCHNESSFPDLMAYMVAVLEYADSVAAADLYRFFPFASGAFARIGFEMVRRGNRNATDALMDRMVQHLRDGDRVAWGGEGRLSGIDGVRRFKVGAALIAIRAGVPVIPVAIHGGHHTMPLGSVRARPGTVRIRFGRPVSTQGLDEGDARDFADRLQGRMAAMYSDLGTEAAAEAPVAAPV